MNLETRKKLLKLTIECALEEFEELSNKQVKSISFVRVRTGLKPPLKEIEYLISVEIEEIAEVI